MATTRLVLPYKKNAIRKHVKKGAQVRHSAQLLRKRQKKEA